MYKSILDFKQPIYLKVDVVNRTGADKPQEIYGTHRMMLNKVHYTCPKL